MHHSFRKYFEINTQVTDEQWEELAAEAYEQTVPKGAILLKQEEVCSEVYFVAKGLLRSYTIDVMGKEHILQFAPEDWWISDRNSFYFNEPSLFFVDAVEESTIIVVTHEFFEKAEKLVPRFTNFNTMALHNSIRFMQRRINQLLSANAEERYLDFITLYPNLTLRIPQWMIASYLGITPESLSRVRKELARRNFRPFNQ
ncbi:Crp/Fnr family transcriptional regulator [Chitinophagaceae bacterium MMS25-I14]